MKLVVLGAAFLAALTLPARNSWSRPVDLSPPTGSVGSADSNGYLAVWREIAEVGLDMGPGSYLPLRYKFSTEENAGGMMGAGFYCPMFEAKNILIREQMMRAFLPCGKGLYLRRNTLDPTRFQTVDQQWSGLLDGDDFVIWRDDGWKLTYHQSRLTSIQTDNNHTFEWSYNDQGVATGVSEDGQPRIGVETDVSGKLSAFNYHGKHYTVDFSNRPAMEVVNGQTLVGKLVSSVSAFHYPDGRTEAFKVLLAPPNLVPTLDFTDFDRRETLYTWDAVNGHIASEKGPEGDWTYVVGAASNSLAWPPITRTDAQGRVQGINVDTKTGTYTVTRVDGSKMITRVFETPGPLYNKVKSIERTCGGITTQIYKASYDESGKLIRSVDPKGFVKIFVYDIQGALKNIIMTPPSDADLLGRLKKKETDLLKIINTTSDSTKKGSLLQNLAFFYIHEMGEPKKALALLPLMTNRQQAFNIWLHAIDGDVTLTDIQKANKFKILEGQFPEQKQLLDALIKARSNT